jgi:hypothetical protein
MQKDGDDAFGYYKQMSTFWTDMISMMSSKPASMMAVGPLRNMTTNLKKITSELTDANQEIIDFNNSLLEYYGNLSETWIDAQKKVTSKMGDVPQDEESIEAYKRVWIDMFENNFTQLFDSKEFSKNYNNLVSKELDLMKRWNTIMDIMLKASNLPTKEEIEEIYKEMHSLKQRITKLESGSKKTRDRKDAK